MEDIIHFAQYTYTPKVWVSLNNQIPVDGYSGATALSDAYNGLVTKLPSLLENLAEPLNTNQ